MMNVGRIVNSPRLSQSFTVYRKGGSFVAGRWTPTESAITVRGVITVSTSDDLEQIPEGDRQKGAISVYSTSQLIVTDATGTSDEIEWRGNRWRAMQLFAFADYGYYKVIAVKMDPSTEVTP